MLLEIRYNGLLILRGMSSIIIRHKHHYSEEIVSFSLSSEVAEVLERIGLSLYQRVGGTLRSGSTSSMTLNEGMDLFKELTVWLQVWYSSPDKPIVLQPTFNLFEVLWEDNDIDGDSRCMQLFFTQYFDCDDVDEGEQTSKGGMFELRADLCRKSISTLGMNGPLSANLVLQGYVDACRGFLTSGYLGKLTSVCA